MILTSFSENGVIIGVMFTEKLDDELFCPVCGAEQVYHEPAGNWAPRFKCPKCRTWLRQQLPLTLEIEWAKDQDFRTFAGYLYSRRCLTLFEYRLSMYYLCMLRGGISPQMVEAKTRELGGDVLAALDYFADHSLETFRRIGKICGWDPGYVLSRVENQKPVIRDYRDRVYELLDDGEH